MPDILSLIHIRKPNGMIDRVLQRHRNAVAFWTGVLLGRVALSESKCIQVEEGLTEPMAFLAQRDLLPAEFDRDEVERLDLLRTRLLRRARLGRQAALHPALDHRLLLSGDEHSRDVRHALVLRLAHRHAVDRHAHEPRAPYLPRERAQRSGVFLGGQGELRDDAGDGGVVAEEVREEALAVSRAYGRRGACAREREAVVDGR